MRAMETARRITVLLPYGFDVDLGRIDHPVTIEVDFFIANPRYM